MARGTVPAVAGLLVLFVASLPVPAGALHGVSQPEILACGRVVNEVGWALDRVSVMAIGLGPKSVDVQPAASALTGADGRFSVGIYNDVYLFRFQDTLSAPERAGALYLPAARQQVGAQGTAPGACGAPIGLALPNVVLLAPAVGFLESRLTDAAAPGPLPDAQSNVTFAAGSWGGALTDAAGMARLSCPLQLPVRVTASKDHYDDAETAEFSCGKNNGLRALDVWRTAVQVEDETRDADTGETLANVAVLATPRTLAPGAGHPYDFDDESDANGSYNLALPWGDTFDLATSRTGYLPGAAELDLVAGDELDPPPAPLTLVRRSFAVADRVRDLDGNGLPGTKLRFVGPAPLEDAVNVTVVDADGSFSQALRQGQYNLTLELEGKNTRTCSVNLTESGTVTVTPTRCFTLLATGRGALQGRVLDGLVASGIPGVDVTIDSASEPTDATGSYALEPLPGSHDLSFAHAAYNAPPPAARAIVLDEILENGDTSLARGRVTLRATAREAGTGAALAGVDVCAEFRRGDDSVRETVCGRTDATGQRDLAVSWSDHPGLGVGFDAGHYRLTAQRSDEPPLYDFTVCDAGFDVPFAALPLLKDCTLPRVPGVETLAGPFRDAHTGAPVPGVLVEATNAEFPCDGVYTCHATSGSDGIVHLSLAQGRDFTFHASHAAYQAVPDESATAGSPVFNDTELARVRTPIDLTVVDAHTTGLVSGADVEATPTGFTCDPGFGGFTCADQTDDAGSAHLELPWGAFDLRVLNGTYDVEIDMLDNEAAVRFEAAGRTLDIAAADPLRNETLRLLRAPGDPIEGRILDFRGNETPNSTLAAATERDGFTCDPLVHDGPAAGFPDCQLQDRAGPYSLVLPHGTTLDHTWGLDAEAPDHFRETATGVAFGDRVNVTLWPLRFDLIVRPVDALTGKIVPLTLVCSRNVNQSIQALPQPPLPQNDVCFSTLLGVEVVFEDVAWIRGDAAAGDDQTDHFLLRALPGPDHLPLVAVEAAGPADPVVVMPLAPTTPEVNLQVGRIEGRVTDATAGGLGIPLAVVTATSLGSGCPAGVDEFVAATDPTGAYSVLVACTGPFRVSVEDAARLAGRPFYTTASADTDVPAALGFDAATLTPTLDPLASATVDFALDRTLGRLQACVLDPGGVVVAPIVNAGGLLTLAQASGPAVGDPRCFTTPPLPWDTYTLAVAQPACPAVGAGMILPGETLLGFVPCL